MGVITISRQFGSGGDEIASRVCRSLSYRMFDKYMVAEAAREVGLYEQDVIDYSEDNHRVASFLERLFGSTTSVGVWPASVAAIYTTQELRIREEDSLHLVRQSIHKAHEKGKIVIIGRGGQVILQDCPDVLHVRIEAPMEQRIQATKELLKRNKQEYLADIDIRREAQDLINQRDLASADYIKQYYSQDWANPMLYHLVINTGKVTVEQAADIIGELAIEMEL